MRLSNATIEAVAPSVRLPRIDRHALRPRIAHLGVGAFHRAHQAVFTEDANEETESDFGIVGISLRSDTAKRQLAHQDYLYSIATQSGDHEGSRIIGSLLKVITATENQEKALSILASEEVSVVTMTITEKGYGLNPASGNLMFDQTDIAADLLSPRSPISAIGLLTEALRRRLEAGAAPFTPVSCDNLIGNGAKLRSAILQYSDRIDSDLATWISSEVPFPQTMVDRIVPATTEEDLRAAERALGLRDEAHVRAEPFRQWVIEDKFATPRPQWEAAGANMTADVFPYENAKLRLLNGAHSAIAYLGSLAGEPFVHSAMARPAISEFIELLMDQEILATLREPGGMSLSAYTEQLRGRFRNSALQHKTSQIAMDGSQKIPVRILDTIRDRMVEGKNFQRLATVVAAWIAYAVTTPGDTLSDPLAERFAEIRSKASSDPAAVLRSFLWMPEIFGELSRDQNFASVVEQPLRMLLAGRIEEAVTGCWE